ncbi:hypothetical protein BJ878DRAFT_493809 [Calycina marina]|uniref:Uncharacterized protein n=1 Tax=Calycina marina TaxID=1763456 RepID=A0A9P7Z7P8_9HELO|nr:hypothetical protein BJ878DRAFT_493809 [Calycina marina]
MVTLVGTTLSTAIMIRSWSAAAACPKYLIILYTARRSSNVYHRHHHPRPRSPSPNVLGALPTNTLDSRPTTLLKLSPTSISKSFPRPARTQNESQYQQ